jgi:protein-tyrosine phosphatase
MLQMIADARRAQPDLDVVVDSCGTAGYHVGEPPDARTVAHAHKRGYDLAPLRARKLAPADFLLFDHIYCMDQNNLGTVRALCPPQHVHKLALFLDVLGEPGREVPDPWAHGPEAFEEVLDLVERGCAAILAGLPR